MPDGGGSKKTSKSVGATHTIRADVLARQGPAAGAALPGTRVHQGSTALAATRNKLLGIAVGAWLRQSVSGQSYAEATASDDKSPGLLRLKESREGTGIKFVLVIRKGGPKDTCGSFQNLTEKAWSST